MLICRAMYCLFFFFFSDFSGGTEPVWPCRKHETWIQSLDREDHLEEAWQPTPVFLLENPPDRGVQQATVHRVAKSWTWLKWLSTIACTIFTCTPSPLTLIHASSWVQSLSLLWLFATPGFPVHHQLLSLKTKFSNLSEVWSYYFCPWHSLSLHFNSPLWEL